MQDYCPTWYSFLCLSIILVQTLPALSVWNSNENLYGTTGGVQLAVEEDQ